MFCGTCRGEFGIAYKSRDIAFIEDYSYGEGWGTQFRDRREPVLNAFFLFGFVDFLFIFLAACVALSRKGAL